MNRVKGFIQLACIVTAGMTALASPPAAAQEAGAGDTALQAAKAEFEEAQALFIKEQWDGAAAKFISAYDKKPFPAFLFNAAVAHEKANRLELAIDYFKRYLSQSAEAKDAHDVELRVTGLERILAAQQGQAPPAGTPDSAPTTVAMLPAIETKGLVIIDSKPAGATIYLDDKRSGPLGTTRWEGSLSPRPVKVIIEAKGFKAEARQINPRPDKILEVYISLSEEHFLGWVEIVSNVAGAEVFLDSKEKGAVGKTPFSGHIKPGKHSVWVERPGYEAVKKEIEVLPGTANTHEFSLAKVAVGWIAVPGKNTRGARLLVDGQVACDTPCEHAVPPGRHRVVVKKEGMEPFEQEINVEQAVRNQLDITFSPEPSRARGWTTAVLSAAFLGAGVYAGLQAQDREDGIKTDIQNNLLVDSADPRVREGKIFAIGANVAFGLAAVTGIMSLVNFLSSGPPSTAEINETNVAITAVPFAGGGGLGAVGRF